MGCSEKKMNTRGEFALRTMSCAVMAALAASSAWAFEMDTGNEDVVINWDNTVRYTYGKRMQGQDPNMLTPQAANYDDGDRNFAKGVTVTNRLDLLSEFDFVYKKDSGFRVSAALWADDAYRGLGSNGGPVNSAGTPVFENTLNSSGTQAYGLSPASKRFNQGPSGEFLDAFVFSNFDVGDVKVNAKLGQHTVYWGESLSFAGAFNGISYSQMPLDLLKGLQFPGAEAKELFRPRQALTLQAQVNPEWSVAGQYFFNWQPARFPESGGYLAFYDVALMGGMSALAVDPRNCVTPNLAGVTCSASVIPRGNDILPSQSGDYGLSLHWSPENVNATFGAYARRYTDQAPMLFYNLGSDLATPAVAVAGEKQLMAAIAPLAAQVNAKLAPFGLNATTASTAQLLSALAQSPGLGGPLTGAFIENALMTGTLPGALGGAAYNPLYGQLAGLPSQSTYFAGYQGNVDLLGLSFSTNVEGVSVGGEVSHRSNTPLVSVNPYIISNPVLYAQFKSVLPALPAIPTSGNMPVALGDTWHGVLNFLGTLPKTELFDTATWMAEINYVSLDKVTSDPYNLYKGGTLYVNSDGSTPIDKPTHDAWNLSLTFTPTWFQALPQTDLSLPISWSRGMRGNSPVSGITNQGTGSYSIGIGAKYAEKYLFDIRYVGYTGDVDISHTPYGALAQTLVSNGFTASLHDRGQLLATFKTTF